MPCCLKKFCCISAVIFAMSMRINLNTSLNERFLPYKTHIRIGTRGSALALAQANEVRDRLLASHPHFEAASIEIVPIKTTGDRILDKNLSEIGGKGLFTKEIEEALIAKTIDIAVHSMKDMPAIIPEGLNIACILPREDPRDAFVSHKYASIGSLPQGAVVGTSSSRRQAQLLAMRPDLEIIPFRGNIGKRIEKLQHGMADAIILAVAGLNRISMQREITAIIPTETMLPAVAQGAIGIECREGDAPILEMLGTIHDTDTALRINAERAFLTVLEGSCRTPIAAYAELADNKIFLQALIASTDGKTIHRTERRGLISDAVKLGTDAGLELKALGGPDFFK